jgi:uncharacterized protein YjbJ (UPF0337 family)
LRTIRAQLPVSKAEIRGRSKQVKGKIREEIGKLTGNKAWRLRGKVEQAEGKARERIGRVVRKTKMCLFTARELS